MKTKSTSIGLARFVKEVTPHIDTKEGKITQRGLFKCEYGHTFTASISGLGGKKDRTCNECNKYSFAFADLLKTKMKMKQLEELLVAPSFGMGLGAIIEQQNLRTEMTAEGQRIERLTPAGLMKHSEELARQKMTATQKKANTLGIVAQILELAADFEKNGNREDSERILTELISILK